MTVTGTWVQQLPLQVVPTDMSATVADLVCAGRYIPAGPDEEPIAGDFYDLLRLGPDLIAIVVGDVAGHGRSALARMQQLRAGARAYATEQSGPASVIARLDRLCGRLDAESIATLWYGEYQPSSGTLTYTSAGHPPPVLAVFGDPTRLLEEATSPPLGVGAADDLAVEHSVVLPPGAVVVAYSDGLVERHDADLGDQIHLLRQIVDAACDPAGGGTSSSIAAQIMQALVPDVARVTDDVCLLVVRRQP